MRMKINQVGHSQKNLGSFNEGPISYELLGLNSGETYYYRFEANNTEFSSWSDAGSFKTLRFDQGVLRFHTGINEDGDQSGLFWDKNGSGKLKFRMQISQQILTSHQMEVHGC